MVQFELLLCVRQPFCVMVLCVFFGGWVRGCVSNQIQNPKVYFSTIQKKSRKKRK